MPFETRSADEPAFLPDRPLVPDDVGAIDLDAEVRRYVRNAVQRYRLGETYWYSVSSTIVQGSAGPVAAYVVTLYARSPVLGAGKLIEGAVQTGFPTGAEFDSIVSNLIESLRTKAREVLR